MSSLTTRVAEYIKTSFERPDEETFNALALEIFQFQYASVPLYRKLCDRRDVTPGSAVTWQNIPAITTDGFKLADLFARPSTEAQLIFSTSGTTQGAKKGRSFFSNHGLALMDAAILENARQYLFPDNLRLRFLIIAPSPAQAPHMIMAYGMEQLRQSFGLPGSRFLVGEQGFNPDELIRELRKAEQENIPVALIGASLGFLAFFDYCHDKRISFQLPTGSRTLDAGGYKGRTRTIARDEFLSLVFSYLGIRQEMSVNLLGMTELGSQLYDNSLKNHFKNLPELRCKENPPWTKTRVLDPRTMKEVPVGEQGILWHLDLTNVERVAFIQTDDIGRRLEHGFEILGRARASEARGCSLSIEELTKSA